MFFLYGSVSILLIFIILLAIRPDLWKQGLIPAFLFIPYGPISELIFSKDYWSPQPVLPQLIIFDQVILMEDIIYAFGVVGIMSISYDVILRKNPVEKVYPLRLLLAVAVSIVSLFLFIWIPLNTKINSIIISSLICIVSGSFLISIRRDLLTVALINGAICGVGAFVFYIIILSIPGAIDYLMTVWKLPVEKAALWFLGIPIPLTEVIWTFAMGFYFGIIYKFAAGSGYEQNENSG